MKISLITLFPEQCQLLSQFGVTGRAVTRELLTIDAINPRQFTTDPYQRVDDRPYGGGPGMVMMAEPLSKAIQMAKASCPSAKVYYMSPQGKPFTQQTAKALAEQTEIILLCGRYEGVDQRLLDAEVDEEISIGDYVLSGGELAALVVIDAVARLLPGVLGHAESASQDSFSQGLLDCPHYTRPEVWQGAAVPAVLLSGDHKAIKEWRDEQALLQTFYKRPELLNSLELTNLQKELLTNAKNGVE